VVVKVGDVEGSISGSPEPFAAGVATRMVAAITPIAE
jgi:hypothetical protein